MAGDTPLKIEMERLQGYQFRVRFPGDVPDLLLDEPPPLGEDKGPSASKLLAAAVGNCLSASLLFCLSKVRIDPPTIKTTVECNFTRNEQKHLRIGSFDVVIDLEGLGEAGSKLPRCAELFEEFCVVSASVRHGVPMHVTVRSDGQTIYTSN